MARTGGQDRGLFERPAGSGVWWIRYHDVTGRERREKAGTKTEARTLYIQCKDEGRRGAIASPGQAEIGPRGQGRPPWCLKALGHRRLRRILEGSSGVSFGVS